MSGPHEGSDRPAADPQRQRAAGGIDIASFSTWIEETAESTGQSEADVLEHLIAAYWKSYERADADGDSPADTDPFRRTLEGRSGQRDRFPNDGSVSASISGPDSHDRRTEPRRGGSHVRDDGESAPTRDRIAQLQETVETHAQEIAELRTAIEEADLDGRASAPNADSNSLETSLESIGADLAALRSAHDSLREYVYTEFANAETIFEHLLENPAATDPTVESLPDVAAELRSHTALLDLQLDALHLGVDTATCEACGAAVELAALSHPDCPSCASTFDDLERESRWFGLRTSSTLLTRDRSIAETDAPSDHTDVT